MKKTLKIITCISLSLTLALLPVSASGPKVSVVNSQTISKNGLITDTKTTTSTWEDGGTSYKKVETLVTAKTNKGVVVSKSGSTENWEESIETRNPTVTIPLQFGKESSTSSNLRDTTTIIQNGYTNTTVLKQRTVTAYLSAASILEKDGTEENAGLTPIKPIWTGDEKDVNPPRPRKYSMGDSATRPVDFDFCFTGTGSNSKYGTTAAVTDKDGETTETEMRMGHLFLTDINNPQGLDHVAYCVDLNTSGKKSWWYKIDNLETAGYYQSKEAEDHIRAIVNHGYWATASGEVGSLSKLIEELEAAKASGIAGLQGHDFTKLTEGEAQCATQMAIWQYGNRYPEDSILKLTATSSNDTESSKEACARIDAVSNYLISLSESKGDTSVVLNKDKFIESISLTVRGKKSTESYNSSLSFSLAATPNEKDNMTLAITLNGEEIATQKIVPGQKDYVIDNLTLPQNKDINLSLDMKGVQYLNKGVYIYTSQEIDGVTSQTFVGIAEGERAVDLSMEASFKFSADPAKVKVTNYSKSSWGNSASNTSNTITPTKNPSTTDILIYNGLFSIVLLSLGLVLFAVSKKLKKQN